MMYLAGKVAVITGSTRGFGLAAARAFAREGATVIISSRSVEAMEKVKSDLQGQGYKVGGMACDVTDHGQVQALADYTLTTFGRLDVWVNNAGWSAPYGPTVHVAPDRFLQVTQTNIQGTYHGSLVAMRHFLAQRRGKLINVLGRGERSPVPMQNAYSASKAWLKSFTLALAAEYKDSGVGVFALSPGMMDTDMLLDVEVIQGYEGRLRIFNGVVQTLSQPPEIPAEKAVWLASSATDGKTGLLVRELTLGKLFLQVFRQSLNRLLRRPGRRVEVHIRSVPAAFPVIKDP